MRAMFRFIRTLVIRMRLQLHEMWPPNCYRERAALRVKLALVSDDRERLFHECLVANVKKLEAATMLMYAEVDNQMMSDALLECSCYTSKHVVPGIKVA